MKRFINYFSFIFLFLPLFSFAYSSPAVTNKDASNIKITTATLNASIDSLGDAKEVEYWFEYGQNSSNFPYKTTSAKSSVSGNIYQNITGLSANNTYYFRVCAKDLVSISCYNTKSFSTFKDPSFSISSSMNIADTTSRLVGSITDLGGSSATVSYWFEYGIGSSYASKGTTSIKTSKVLDYVYFDVSSLKPSTTYYYRLCGKNEFSSANTCTSDSSFTTLVTSVSQGSVEAPVVKTVKYDFTSLNSVSMTGSLESMGKFTSLNYYFEYGPNLSYGNAINDSKNLTIKNTFSSEIKGLQFGMTYYFRACVRDLVNTNNSYCGEPSYFNIFDYKNEKFGISLLQISNVKDTSAKLNAAINGFGGFDEVTAYFNVTDLSGKIVQTSRMKVPYTLRNFSVLAENLLPGSTYKYSACLFTISSVYCDPAMSIFTTLKSPVIESTDSSIKDGIASLYAKVSDVGASVDLYSNVKTWFTYSTDPTFKTNSVDTTKTVYYKDSISEVLSNLKKDTKYYYKFCLDNSLGAICSNVKDFTVTTSVIPVDPTKPVVNVDNLKNPELVPVSFIKKDASNVEIGFKVSSFGGDINSLVYINWGDSTAVSNKTIEAKVSDEGAVSYLNLSGLSLDKKYYYKICAKNTSLTNCTNVFNFKLFKDNGSSLLAKIPKDFKNVNLNVKYAETVRGKILIQNQSGNLIWYVNPVNLRRYYLGNYQNAFNALKVLNNVLTDTEFSKFIKNKATSSYSGKIVSKASEPNKFYYVDPRDLRMWYFVDSSELAFVISKVFLNISNANLLKIDYYDFTDVVYNVDKQDTDGDTIYDNLEINVYKTNPYEIDTDGDAYPDNIEIKNGYSPFGEGKLY